MLAPSLLLLAMLGQVRRYPAQVYVASPPNGPATQQFADYPIHVRILEAHWNFNYGNYIGWGRADLLGDDPRGFDFTYNCAAPFMFNQLKGDFYEAQWRTPDRQLKLLVQRMGSDHLSTCTLKTEVKPARYSAASSAWTTPDPPSSTRPSFSTPANPASPPPPATTQPSAH